MATHQDNRLVIGGPPPFPCGGLASLLYPDKFALYGYRLPCTARSWRKSGEVDSIYFLFMKNWCGGTTYLNAFLFQHGCWKSFEFPLIHDGKSYLMRTPSYMGVISMLFSDDLVLSKYIKCNSPASENLDNITKFIFYIKKHPIFPWLINLVSVAGKKGGSEN